MLSKVKVTGVKVKRVKGQGHGIKVVGQVQKGQGHKGQGRRFKVNVVWEILHHIDSREVRHADVFILKLRSCSIGLYW